MSDAFYIDIRDNTVIPLLTEFGTTYNVVTPGAVDNTDYSQQPDTQTPVIGLISDGSFVNNLLESEGAIRQWTSQRILLLVPDAAVERGVKIIVDGMEHDLSKLEKIQPANINVLYILDLES